MILDGKIAAGKLFEKLLLDIEKLDNKPALAVIQVGTNSASTTYIKLKKKKLESLGLKFNHIHLSESVSELEVSREIELLNSDKSVGGILLQLPLPAHLNSRKLLDLISPKKDPDCLTSVNLGNFFVGESDIMPATPLGVLRLLNFYNIPVEGKNVCVVGRSNLVGKPLAIALTALNATVTICHSKTEGLSGFTQKADIVITAVGRAKYFGKEFFRAGQSVIDVGTSIDENGRLSGDVKYSEVIEIVENLTPVPGGVGPMTIYGLIENFVKQSLSSI